MRDADGLSRLLDSRHPLVRAVGRGGLTRAESRGAHQRSDHPQRDPELDGRHVVLAGADTPVGASPTGGSSAPIDDRIAWQSWS